MGDKIDFTLQVLQTTIRVIYADITRLEVDVLVCPDDVLLTMKGSVSTSLHMAAGAVLRDDAYKYPRPQSVGDVLITSAGRLKARHVFRVITFDMNNSQKAEVVLPKVVKRVLTLANTLGVKRLAMPLLMTGHAGMTKPQALDMLLRLASCHLVAHPSLLRELIIAVYSVDTSDQAASEQQLFNELATVRSQIALWIEPAKRLNTRIELLQALSEAIPDDSEIDTMVKARIEADKADLRQLLGCPEGASDAPELHKAAPLSAEEHERAQNRLIARIDDLAAQITHVTELRKIEQSRLHHLERIWRRKGDNTPTEIITEISEIKLRIEQYNQDIQKAEEQHKLACQDLEGLRHRRQKRVALES